MKTLKGYYEYDGTLWYVHAACLKCNRFHTHGVSDKKLYETGQVTLRAPHCHERPAESYFIKIQPEPFKQEWQSDGHRYHSMITDKYKEEAEGGDA